MDPGRRSLLRDMVGRRHLRQWCTSLNNPISSSSSTHSHSYLLHVHGGEYVQYNPTNYTPKLPPIRGQAPPPPPSFFIPLDHLSSLTHHHGPLHPSPRGGYSPAHVHNIPRGCAYDPGPVRRCTSIRIWFATLFPPYHPARASNAERTRTVRWDERSWQTPVKAQEIGKTGGRTRLEWPSYGHGQCSPTTQQAAGTGRRIWHVLLFCFHFRWIVAAYLAGRWIA